MRVLAIDLGIKYVGLAISGPLKIPQPLKCIRRKNIFEGLKEVISEYSIELIVIGLPLTPAGKEGNIARNTRNFANLVEERLGIKTRLVDERFTTKEAKRVLNEKGIKGNDDSISALFILERYLEERSN